MGVLVIDVVTVTETDSVGVTVNEGVEVGVTVVDDVTLVDGVGAGVRDDEGVERVTSTTSWQSVMV